MRTAEGTTCTKLRRRPRSRARAAAHSEAAAPAADPSTPTRIWFFIMNFRASTCPVTVCLQSRHAGAPRLGLEDPPLPRSAEAGVTQSTSSVASCGGTSVHSRPMQVSGSAEWRTAVSDHRNPPSIAATPSLGQTARRLWLPFHLSPKPGSQSRASGSRTETSMTTSGARRQSRQAQRERRRVRRRSAHLLPAG